MTEVQLGMKRWIAGALALLVMTALPALGASSYHLDEKTGLYVYDDTGEPVNIAEENDDFWIKNGVKQEWENLDDGSSAAPVLDENGGMTVESGTVKSEDESEGAPRESGHLTQAEWEARMAKALRTNGTTTPTFWTDENGTEWPVELLYLGLGRSAVLLNGEDKLVPTCELRWETKAPKNKVMAVVSTTKQSYATLRASKSKKGFVLDHVDKCRVVQVLGTGKTWTMVDNGSGMRGYVLTSTLTFYENVPRDFGTGMITIRGKADSRDTVHIRSVNKNTGKQLDEFPCGTPLTIFSADEKWTEVDVCGWHCYILSEFVTADSASAETAAAR